MVYKYSTDIQNHFHDKYLNIGIIDKHLVIF